MLALGAILRTPDSYQRVIRKPCIAKGPLGPWDKAVSHANTGVSPIGHVLPHLWESHLLQLGSDRLLLGVFLVMGMRSGYTLHSQILEPVALTDRPKGVCPIMDGLRL